MTRIIYFLLVGVLILTATASAVEIPPVPANVLPVKVQNGGDSANLYVWVEDGIIYMHIDPISMKYTACPDLVLIQNDEQFTEIYMTEVGYPSEICKTAYVPCTVQIRLHGAYLYKFHGDLSEPFVLIYQSKYTINVNSEQGVIRASNGIWKSHDGVLGMYVQKYQAGSCVLVVTMGDGTYTAFLDEDYTDGLVCSNDLDNHGHTLNLSLTDSSHGTLTVTLPGYGEVVTPVELRFGDEK